MAAWMVSQASGSPVGRNRVAVLKAGTHFDEELSGHAPKGGYKARMPPEGDA